MQNSTQIETSLFEEMRKHPFSSSNSMKKPNMILNYPQAKDLWDSDFIKECLQASLTPSPSV